MLWHWRTTAVLVGTLALAAPVCGADEDEIPLAQVPAVVRRGADKAVPDAKWTKSFKTTEDDETVFELVGRDSKGREVEIELTPAGKVLEIETGMPMSDVPKLILGVLETKLKGIKIERARSVTRDGMVVAYSFEGKNAKAQAVEVRVSKDGKAVEVEVDGT